METRNDNVGESPITIASLRKDYLSWVLVGLALAILVAIYAKTMQGWWISWMMVDSRYSHGILVPFISLFAIYVDRERLSKIPIRPNIALGVTALSLVILAGLIYRAARIPSMESLNFPLFLIAAIILLFGTEMATALLFPCLFLFFMVPLPGFLLSKIEFRIQLWSTIISTGLLRLMQFQVERVGNLINMPSISVHVALACSGFRMLISLFAFSTFFAYMKEGPKLGRIGLVLSAMPLSLLANSVRITLVALVGEFFGDDAMHAFHDYSGYLILVASFITLECVSRLFKCRKFRLMQ
jgi:exosortase